MNPPRRTLSPAWLAAAFFLSVLALLLTPFLRRTWGEPMVEAARIGVLAPVSALMLLAGLRAARVWRGASVVLGGFVAAALLSWGAFWPSFAGLVLVFGGLGAGLALGRLLAADEPSAARGALWWGLGLVGAAVALWLWTEDRWQLWKLVPTNWEILKNLEYKEGIRHGLGRARATFGHTTGAAVWQWFTGTLLVFAAWAWLRGRGARVLALLAGALCFTSIVPTLARAGVMLAGLTVAVAAAQWVPWGNRRRIGLIALAAAALLGSAALAHRFVVRGDRPWLRSFTSIAAPGETGNSERLALMWEGLATLPDVPWRGRGLDSITPRFPESAQVNFENTQLSITHALGLAGGLLSVALTAFLAASAWRAWLFLGRRRDPVVLLSVLLGGPMLAYLFVAPCLWYWEQAFVLWCCVGVICAAHERMNRAAPESPPA